MVAFLFAWFPAVWPHPLLDPSCPLSEGWKDWNQSKQLDKGIKTRDRDRTIGLGTHLLLSSSDAADTVGHEQTPHESLVGHVISFPPCKKKAGEVELSSFFFYPPSFCFSQHALPLSAGPDTSVKALHCPGTSESRPGVRSSESNPDIECSLSAIHV